jgi:hypothetical protein
MAVRRSFGPLNDLLWEIFPDHRTPQGVFDVQRLAADIERTNEAVYKWLRDNKITPDGVKRLCKAAGRRAKQADFLPFLGLS